MGYTLSYLPENNHLVVETSTAIYYVRADDETELWKIVLATGVNSQVDVDPDNSSGDAKSRTQKIQALWYDGTYIWGVDCNNPGDAFDVWKLQVSNDSCTEIGSSTGADVNTVYVYDIWVYNANTYVINHEARVAAGKLVVWDVDTAPFTEKTTESCADCHARTDPCSYGVLVGDTFWFMVDNEGCNNVRLYYYDAGAVVIGASDAGGAGYSLSSSKNLQGIAYDGTNLLYMIWKEDADGLNYLVSYSISGNTFTVGIECNIAIQLDRFCNVLGTETLECFQYEKAFGITVGTNSMYVYRIPRVYSGNLWLIASLKDAKDTSGNAHGALSKILAITDHYLIVDRDGDGDPIQVWEYIDVMSTLIAHYEIVHKTLTLADYYPSCNLIWLKKNGYQDPPIVDQIVQIYGRYSNVLLSETCFYGPNAPDDIHEEAVDTSGTDIDWVDSVGGTDTGMTKVIIAELDGHKNILKSASNGDNGAYSDIYHTISATSGTYELYIAYKDLGQGWVTFDIKRQDYLLCIRLLANSATNKLHIYYGNGAGGVTSANIDLASETFAHVKITFDCATDTFSCWMNGTLKAEDVPFYNDRVATSMIEITLQLSTGGGVNALEAYLDAIGDVADANYYEGQNKNEYLDDAVVFEGMVRDRNRNIEREIYIESLAKEDLEQTPVISSYTNYTGQTTGVILAQLITDFCKYITAGIISAGSNTFVCPDDWSCDGDKSLLTIILELTDGELFLARTRPKGELDVDNGATVSNITLTEDVAYWDQLLREFSQRINQVVLYGGFVDGEIVGPAEANNTLHQQQSGQIITWSKTYASILDLTLLGTFATNKLLLQGSAPLIYWLSRNMADYGFIQTGLTIAIPTDTMKVQAESDEKVPAGAYVLYDNIYEGKNQVSDFKLVDGLYFFEDASESLSEQNSQLIEQLADYTITTVPRIHVEAGDPTVNDDIDLGYKSGDIWINSADAGVFICISATDGAANWDELAKV